MDKQETYNSALELRRFAIEDVDGLDTIFYHSDSTAVEQDNQ